MTIDQFWNIIELAWTDSPDLDLLRRKALKDNDEEQLVELQDALSGPILENFDYRLRQLSKDELTNFIHILEEQLYNIDREDIHNMIEGSDDGFLYGRCFILGMGREYYSMIDADPSKGTPDVEAEGFGFKAYQTYKELFNEKFDRYSVHSIESGSNPNGWREF